MVARYLNNDKKSRKTDKRDTGYKVYLSCPWSCRSNLIVYSNAENFPGTQVGDFLVDCSSLLIANFQEFAKILRV